MNHTQYTPHQRDASQPPVYRPGFRADSHPLPHPHAGQQHQQRVVPLPQYLRQPPVLRMPSAPRGPADSNVGAGAEVQSVMHVNVRDSQPSPEQSRETSPLPAYPVTPSSPRIVKVSTPSPDPRPTGPPLDMKRASPPRVEPVPESVRQQAARAGQDAQSRRIQMPSAPPMARLRGDSLPVGSQPTSPAPSRASAPASTTQFGSLGADSAKPQPQRRQYTEGEGAKPQKLDIERFEAIRRSAAAQPHDPSVQMDYAKTLAEAADLLASRYTDPATPSTMHVDAKSEQRNRESWTREALTITRKLALKVMLPEAQFFLGCSYSTGTLGLEVDSAKAFELYTRAAKSEHPQASYRVAVCYELGVGTRRDIDRALTWYRRAAQLGDVSSMYKLGMLALDADQIDEGLKWLSRAADLGEQSSPHALHQLGLLYEGSDRASGPSPRRRRSSSHSRRHSRSTSMGSIKSTTSSTSGQGYGSGSVPRDPARALSFYYSAARLGYAPSQFRMGHAYEYGELGCELDAQKSISWYTAAAQQGDSEAELALSGWYWTGAAGVLRKCDTEAFLWAQRAADKGLGKAFFCLGHYYENGIGVESSAERAKHWFTRALEQKHPKAAGRLKMLERSALSPGYRS